MTTTREAQIEAKHPCIGRFTGQRPGHKSHRSYTYSDGRQHYCERCGEKLDHENFSNIPEGYVTTHDLGDYNRAALSTPATEPQGYVVVDPVESICTSVRSLIADARAERDRFGNIAATIRINALHHGATNAEVDAMLSGELDFIKWVCAKVEAHTTSSEHDPQSCLEDDGCPTEKAVLKRFWREHQALAAHPAPQPAGDTRVVTVAQLNEWEAIWAESIAALDSEDYATGDDKRACDEIRAIIGNATPAPSDKIAEALAKQTSGGERQRYSGFGHMLSEASWHVHLAGFRSRDEAEAAMRALAGQGE